MNFYIIIILIILLIIFYYIYTTNDLNKICNNLEFFRYGSSTSDNKTILILGGIHGNEPAGSKAIYQLMDELNTNKITTKNKLILIPYVNYCALQLNIRSILGIGDLNRKFPDKTNYNDNNLHPIIKKILLFIKEADIVLDFHEGWGFYRDNNGSIGSTITPSNTKKSIKLANELYDRINKDIIDNNKKFTILVDEDSLIKTDNNKYGKTNDIKHTLRYYVNLINKDYLLIETSGQNDIQDIVVRTNQNRKIIDYIINL
jgi:hypothetical protein